MRDKRFCLMLYRYLLLLFNIAVATGQWAQEKITKKKIELRKIQFEKHIIARLTLFNDYCI